MNSDDLTPFLGSKDLDALKMRQGVVVAFNSLTGASTINVAGTLLTDVPFLSSGSLLTLYPGDVVVLLAQASSWFILGLVNRPGGTKAVGRSVNAGQAYGPVTGTGFAMSTAATTMATLSVVVPEWARIADTVISVHLLAKNTSAVIDFTSAGVVAPDGSVASWTGAQVPAAVWGGQPFIRHWTGFVTPLSTISFQGQANSTGGAWAADALNRLRIAASIRWSSGDGS